MTFKYRQTTACDLARLQGIESAKPVLVVVVVAEVQSESEIPLGVLSRLLVGFCFYFFLGCIWKRGEDPTASL